jgi:single-stranded-DNA-specific exonuclease
MSQEQHTQTLFQSGVQQGIATMAITIHTIPSQPEHDSSLEWITPNYPPEAADKISQEYNAAPIIGQILSSRGITKGSEIRRYLYGQLPDLYDPFLFPEMEKAVERIYQAYIKQEAILVYGDNDVDGITGTALLVEYFRFIGIPVYFNISHYTQLRSSVIIDALNGAIKNRCKLIITVDHGITAAAEIEQLLSAQIDVIVTDHHEPTESIPRCVATLNPKMINASYPDRELTGVGVAFKFIHAVTSLLVKRGIISRKKIDLKRYLDLVALGTLADMGSLNDENRILVKYGLIQLRKGRRIGLTKLLGLVGIENSQITSTALSTKLIPQLNSLGRIANARKGVELLLMRNSQMAQLLAEEIECNNRQRQRIEKEIAADVEQLFASPTATYQLNQKALIIVSNQWHAGVIPIIVARLTRQYNRPVCMIAIDNGIGRGSCRTIRKFPLLAPLKQIKDLFINFGGHDYAAGITIQEELIPLFCRQFIAIANASLAEEDVKPELHIDADVNFVDLTFDFMESLNLFEPYGNDNPPPILYTIAQLSWPAKIIHNDHLRFYLEQNGLLLEGIGFSLGHRAHQLRHKGTTIALAFTPQINVHHQKHSIQLLIRDFKVLSTPFPPNPISPVTPTHDPL